MTLSCEFSRGLQDQISELSNIHVQCLPVSQVLLQNWKQVACSFTTSSHGMGQHIVAIQDCRNDFPLDNGRVVVVKFKTSSYEWFLQHQLVKLYLIFFVVMKLSFFAFN